MGPLTYPPTRTVAQVDDYHGTLVADPYRWLEDTVSPETQAWVAAQNALTFGVLAKIPARERLQRRLTELWDFPRQQAPARHGHRYFQLRNSGLQNQDVLYVFDRLDAEPRVLLDPNTFSPDGTISLAAWSVSPDGRHLAYATSASGSDWLTWRIRAVDTREDLPERIEWSKFSDAAWRPDGAGFYYARYDAPAPDEAFTGANYHQQLYWHALGTPQAADVLVYARPDQKEWGFSPVVTDDGRYLVIQVWHGTDHRQRIFYQDLATGGAVTALVPNLEAAYSFVGSDGSWLFFLTDLDAPRSRLIAIDVERPAREHWQSVIPEGPDTLESVKHVHGQFVALYLHHAYHQLRLFTRHGAPAGEIATPTLGSVSLDYTPTLSGRPQDDELFYVFHSFVYPFTVFRYDFASGQSAVLYQPPFDFDFSPYTTRQVFATSPDGTAVPMFLVHRRDLKTDGQNPTWLYGYGGFNLAQTPTFKVGRLAWLELGGVVAVANLRGGSEYGEAWHQAGCVLNRQNVFDDFIACAEHLIAQGITRPARLSIEGRSNGGLLVGAVLAQRPELFGAAVAHVGVMDMLRFHKFTIGWGWVSDYGSSDQAEQFRVLYGYSPLHNLRPGAAYPATLITTGDHDDRVVPGHSFKFAAALQAAQGGPAPVLIRVETKAGHGGGKPTALVIAEQADAWAFVIEALDME